MSDLISTTGNYIIAPTRPMSFSFHADGNQTLFTIRPDGTIERGTAFTTEDEMSLKFWEIIQRVGFKLAAATEMS